MLQTFEPIAGAHVDPVAFVPNAALPFGYHALLRARLRRNPTSTAPRARCSALSAEAAVQKSGKKRGTSSDSETHMIAKSGRPPRTKSANR